MFQVKSSSLTLSLSTQYTPLPLTLPISTNDSAITHGPWQESGYQPWLSLSTLLSNSPSLKNYLITVSNLSIFFCFHYHLYQLRPSWALAWIIKNTARQNILWHKSYQYQSPKATEIKTKVNKWDLIKLTSFFTAKETINGRTYLQIMQQTRV